MTDTPKPKPAPKPTPKPADDDHQAHDADTAPDQDTPEARRAHRDALRAQLALLEEDDQDGPEPPEPTHRLTLSNGDQVETSGAVPTHHSTDAGVFRVIDAEPIDGTR